MPHDVFANEHLPTAPRQFLFGDRTQIVVSGDDCVSFIQSFSTNDVAHLQPNDGCELFFTNLQGKILGHAFVFRGEDALIVETVPGQAESLIAHLDKYLFAERVAFEDQSAEFQNIVVFGASAMQALDAICSAPTELYGHVSTTLFEQPVTIRKLPFTAGDCYAIATAANACDAMQQSFTAAGILECSPDVFHAARIAAGFPLYIQDLSDANLPQEAGRVEQTINYAKGCYLGQETVHRIYAMGHVNRQLCRLQLTGGPPPQGAELIFEEKPVGVISSAVTTSDPAKHIALAMVRRPHQEPGSKLQYNLQGVGGVAEVI